MTTVPMCTTLCDMATGRQPHLDPAERRAQQALDLVMRVRSRSDREVAERLRCSRPTVTQKRLGRTRISLGDVDAFAQALDVPSDLFRMEEPEIYLWFAEWAARDSNPEPAEGGFEGPWRPPNVTTDTSVGVESVLNAA